MKKKNIAILGSTGSIGTQALKVISAYPRLLKAVTLAAGGNFKLLLEQIKNFKPKAVAVNTSQAIEFIKKHKPKNCLLYTGEKGLTKIACLKEVDLVLVAIPGIQALIPTIEAMKQKKDIAIATKEILVAAGELILELAKKNKIKLLPVDSEHSAVLQCLKNESPKKVKRIILTASGGPFFRKKLSFFKKVTPSQALNHPTWLMGPKITVDSATLMNKGLEVIEAHHLFNLPYEKIEVLIHPESIVHSIVEFVDGTCIAQLAQPDMTLPIQYAFFYPQRLPRSYQELVLQKLTFFEPDLKKFPCLKLAYLAGKTGGTAPAVLSSANEVAVSAFLKGELPFLKIADVVKEVLEKHQPKAGKNLKEILFADSFARQTAQKIMKKYG